MNINDMIKKAEEVAETVKFAKQTGTPMSDFEASLTELIAAIAEELKQMRRDLAGNEHSVGFLEGLLEETKEELRQTKLALVKENALLRVACGEFEELELD